MKLCNVKYCCKSGIEDESEDRYATPSVFDLFVKEDDELTDAKAEGGEDPQADRSAGGRSLTSVPFRRDTYGTLLNSPEGSSLKRSTPLTMLVSCPLFLGDMVHAEMFRKACRNQRLREERMQRRTPTTHRERRQVLTWCNT